MKILQNYLGNKRSISSFWCQCDASVLLWTAHGFCDLYGCEWCFEIHHNITHVSVQLMWHLLSLFFLQYHSVDNVYATTHECLLYNYKIFLQILNFFLIYFCWLAKFSLFYHAWFRQENRQYKRTDFVCHIMIIAISFITCALLFWFLEWLNFITWTRFERSNLTNRSTWP